MGDARLNWIDVPNAKLTAVERSGGRIAFVDRGKPVTASTAGAKVTIANNPVKASALEPGLSCEISYLGDRDNARMIACH